MLLQEHFPDLASWKVQILGTDLSDDVLEKAREARFSQIEMNRGLPAALLAKYFRRDGMQWELVPHIRGMASFCKLNLIERWPTLPIDGRRVSAQRSDLLLARNQEDDLEKIRAVMAPHGVLFLGAAETTMGLDAAFHASNSRTVFSTESNS